MIAFENFKAGYAKNLEKKLALNMCTKKVKQGPARIFLIIVFLRYYRIGDIRNGLEISGIIA
jgi:hypothetical protein